MQNLIQNKEQSLIFSINKNLESDEFLLNNI